MKTSLLMRKIYASDISKCDGEGCPIRSKCLRYVSEPNNVQSWISMPGKFINNQFKCELFYAIKDDKRI